MGVVGSDEIVGADEMVGSNEGDDDEGTAVGTDGWPDGMPVGSCEIVGAGDIVGVSVWHKPSLH